VLIDKPTVTQLVTNIPPFMEPEVSFPCSQEPATGPYPDSDISNPQLLAIFP